MKINKENLFEIIDSLISKEEELGIKFNIEGFPLFEKWMFFDSIPKEILPFRHRKSAKNHSESAICFYEPDESLYPKIKKLDYVAEELRNYKCFVGFDLSIFSDFLKPFQRFYALANLVIDIYLILNGNRMIPNLRADESGGSYFALFEEAPIVCCGTLGCSLRKTTKKRNMQLIAEYLSSHKRQTLIQYGPGLIKAKNTVNFKSFGWRCH